MPKKSTNKNTTNINKKKSKIKIGSKKKQSKLQNQPDMKFKKKNLNKTKKSDDNNKPTQHIHSINVLLNIGDANKIIQQAMYSFFNVNNLSNEITPIGSNSINGFIRKITYVSPNYKMDLILKNNKKLSSDNLVYEYLTGQCVNHFSKYYPCFIKTYQICAYKSDDDFNEIQKITRTSTVSKPLGSMLNPLNTQNIEELIKNSCKTPNLCLISQYVDFYSSLESQVEHMEKHKLLIILYLIFSCLSSFADQFTHYDLHAQNVQLVRIPSHEKSGNPRCVVIKMHLKNGQVVSFKTRYLPVIIDYGRSFVKCSGIHSDKILQTVCKFDETNKRIQDRVCRKRCGDKRGYWTPDYDYAKQKFLPTTKHNYFIDPTRRNISYDLHLLHILKLYYDEETSQKMSLYFVFSDECYRKLMTDCVPPEGQQGMPENASKSNEKIYNVHTAAARLTNIVKDEQFAKENSYVFHDYEVYKTIDIWEDLSHPFIVR
jgi:hypothetical protein